MPREAVKKMSNVLRSQPREVNFSSKCVHKHAETAEKTFLAVSDVNS